MALRSLVGPHQFVLGIDEHEHKLLSTILTILRTGPVPTTLPFMTRKNQTQSSYLEKTS